MFSVLLSVYRKEQPAYLLQCLTSIFNQTLLPDEVVLVKDVSGIKIGVLNRRCYGEALEGCFAFYDRLLVKSVH